MLSEKFLLLMEISPRLLEKGRDILGTMVMVGRRLNPRFGNPYSVAYDAAGNVYFADAQEAMQSERLHFQQEKISTIAGLGPVARDTAETTVRPLQPS